MRNTAILKCRKHTHRVSGERTRRGGNGGCITHLGSSDVHPSDWFVIYLHNLVAHADQASLVRGATSCNILQAGNGEGGRADCEDGEQGRKKRCKEEKKKKVKRGSETME